MVNVMNAIKILLLASIISFVLSGCTVTEVRPELNDIQQLQAHAHAAYEAKEYELAITRYQEVQTYLDKDPYVWFRLGNCYSHLQQPDEAINAYRKAVFFDPTMSKAWHNMGVMQLRQTANTWTQMLVHTLQSDPLYPKAERYSQDTLKALNQK